MSKAIDNQQCFVIYNTLIEAASNLNDAAFRECMLKIRDYAMYGICDKSDDWGVNLVMDMAKPILDAAKNRHQRCVENGMKGKEYGKLGGRPKRATEPQEKPQAEPLNDNAYVNVYDYVNEYDNLNENLKDNLKDNVYNSSGAINSTDNKSLNSTTHRPSDNFIDSLIIEDDYDNPSSIYPSDLHEQYMKYKLLTPTD